MPAHHPWMPHGFCFAWDPPVLIATAGGDAVTALCYVLIPYLIATRFLRQGLWVSPRHWAALTVGFSLFIACCGLGHATAVLTLWYPYYRLEAAIKVVTALVSVGVVVMLLIDAASPEESPEQSSESLARVRTLLTELEARQ